MDRRQLNAGSAIDYLYDGQDMIAEHDAGANPQGKRYVHGAGIDNPLVEYVRQGDGTYARTWYAADFRGSIVATTNDAGTTTAIYAYGDYGEPNTLGGPAFRYTGQRLDADSGLYYYKARWYSPNLGRFLSTDPVGTADDVNLYTYVANDPVNALDPSGTSSADSWDLTDYEQEPIIITAQRSDLYRLPETSWDVSASSSNTASAFFYNAGLPGTSISSLNPNSDGYYFAWAGELNDVPTKINVGDSTRLRIDINKSMQVTGGEHEGRKIAPFFPQGEFGINFYTQSNTKIGSYPIAFATSFDQTRYVVIPYLTNYISIVEYEQTPHPTYVEIWTNR